MSVFTLLLITLLAFICAPLCAEETTATSVAVIMDFEEEHSAASLDEMKREFESIMRPSGVHFDWRILDDAVTKEFFSHLVVARFRGACRMLPDEDPEFQAGALGLTHVSDGDILPFSEVDCNRIRGLIHEEVEDESFPRAESLLGRALARVLAHELYHMLADTKKHAGGITKPVLAPHDLVAGRLNLEEAQARLIRKKLQVHPEQLVAGFK